MHSETSPGPWRVIRRANQTGLRTATVVSARGNTPVCEPKNHSDASLIAGAPDMLAALQLLVRGYGVTFQDEALRGLAKDAIAKATGVAA